MSNDPNFEQIVPPPDEVWNNTEYEKIWQSLISTGITRNTASVPESSENPTEYDRSADEAFMTDAGVILNPGEEENSVRSAGDIEFYTLYDVKVNYIKTYPKKAYATTNKDRPTTVAYLAQPQYTKEITFNIVREGKMPKLPRFKPRDGENLELIRREISPLELDTSNGRTCTYKISGKYEYIVLNPGESSRFVEFPVAPHIRLHDPLLDAVLDMQNDVFEDASDIVTPYTASQIADQGNTGLNNEPTTQG